MNDRSKLEENKIYTLYKNEKGGKVTIMQILIVLFLLLFH